MRAIPLASPLALRVATLALWLGATVPAAFADEPLSCMVEPHAIVDASTAVEGILSSVDVRKGDIVRRGQVIATLASDAERANVAIAEARAKARAALAARKARVTYARGKVERARELNQKSFMSAEETEQVQLELELAELELEEERERIELLRIDLARANALLELRTVRSPIDGVVVERFLSAGEFAQAQRIVRLAQVDPLNIEVVMPTSAFGSVEQGEKALVTLAEPVGGEFEARVELVDRVIDGASATFSIRLQMPNTNYRLPAGIDCTVRFGGQR